MTVVDELTIAFKADIADLKTGMSQIKSELGGLQQSAKALSFIEAGEALKGMGQGFTQNVTTPILGFFQDSIRASSDNAEEVSKLKQLFGDLTPAAEQWISATATSMGRGEDMVRQFASSFGAVLTPQFKGQEQKALDLSKTYTTLAVDLASFFNTTEEEAKAALMSGISGETEPLRRYGVMLSEAALNAELLAMGVDTSTRAATDAEKQQARLNIIMDATSKAQGDAVRTGDGWANTMRALEGMITSVKVAIGDVLMPVILPLVTALKNALAWFKELDPGIMRIGVVLGILAAAIGPVLVVVGGLVGMFGSMLAIIGTGGLAAGFTALTGAIVPLIAPVLAVVAAVALLVGGFAVMYTSSERFRDMVGGIITGVVDMGKAFIEWITPIKDTIVAAVMPALKNFGDFLGEQFQKIVVWVKGEGRTFIDFLGAIADGLQVTIVNGIKTLGAIYRDYLEPVLQWLISTALDFVLDKLKDLGDWFKSPQVQQGIKDVGTALEDVWKWLDDLGTLINTTVLPALDDFFGRFDSQHQDGLAGTIDLLKLLWDAGDALSRLLRGDLAGAYDAAKTFNNDLNEAIKTGLNPTLGDAKTAMGNLASTTNDAKTAAVDARDPFTNLKSPLDDIKTSAGNAAVNLDAVRQAYRDLIEYAAAHPGAAYQGPIGPQGQSPIPPSENPRAPATPAPTAPAPTTPAPAINPPARPPTTAAEIAAEARRRAEEEARRKAAEGPVNGTGITVVRQWIEGGYWWTQFSDGTKKRGAAYTPPIVPGDRRNFGASGISLTIINPVGETPSQSMQAARRLARRLGSGAAVI